MNLGSLCSGYGGLDLAVESVLGTTTAWVCEYDPAPSLVLESRFPGVPNLHDLTTVDWSQVPPVDVLTAGYPCQPFSHAGKREGTNDVRHLWPHIAECLRVLRPRLAVFENVAGHVSLGFDAVLADLAALGFDAEWVVVRASDVGACHRRERLFILATDTGRDGLDRGEEQHGEPPARFNRSRRRHVDGRDVEDAPPGLGIAGATAADTDDGRRCERDESQRRVPVAGLNGRDVAAHAPGARRTWRQDAGASRTDAGEDECWRVESERGGSSPVWGDYGPAIDRHARALGRPAPAPVDDKGRLSPRFVEWMQMLPDGWVTDVLTARTKALKCLGNGVVPPQAAYALTGLLERQVAA